MANVPGEQQGLGISEVTAWLAPVASDRWKRSALTRDWLLALILERHSGVTKAAPARPVTVVGREAKTECLGLACAVGS